MSQQELLKTVVATLDRLGIDYMLTGSVVSSLQGEPRSTHDIDIVINLPGSKAHGLATAFPSPAYYLDEDALAEAISGKGMVNLIDTSSGDKVDFWLLTEDPFDRSRFSRRYREQLFGMHIAVSTPEDTILMKLRWSRLSGGSEKQFTDAVRIFEVQRGRLAEDYMKIWAEKLGLNEDYKRLREEAKTV